MPPEASPSASTVGDEPKPRETREHQRPGRRFGHAAVRVAGDRTQDGSRNIETIAVNRVVDRTLGEDGRVDNHCSEGAPGALVEDGLIDHKSRRGRREACRSAGKCTNTISYGRARDSKQTSKVY